MPPLIESGAGWSVGRFLLLLRLSLVRSLSLSLSLCPHNDEIRRIIQSPLAFWGLTGLALAGCCGLRLGYKGLTNDHVLLLLYEYIRSFADVWRFLKVSQLLLEFVTC